MYYRSKLDVNCLDNLARVGEHVENENSASSSEARLIKTHG